MNEADTYANVEVTWIDIVSDSSWLDKKAVDKLNQLYVRQLEKFIIELMVVLKYLETIL